MALLNIALDEHYKLVKIEDRYLLVCEGEQSIIPLKSFQSADEAREFAWKIVKAVGELETGGLFKLDKPW